MIDEETRQFIDDAYEDARRMLDTNWEKVVAVAEALLRYETLQRDDVDRLMRGEQMGRPTVADLLAAESARKPLQVETQADDPEAGLGGAIPTPA